jgi:hypothetical protein
MKENRKKNSGSCREVFKPFQIIKCHRVGACVSIHQSDRALSIIIPHGVSQILRFRPAKFLLDEVLWKMWQAACQHDEKGLE